MNHLREPAQEALDMLEEVLSAVDGYYYDAVVPRAEKIAENLRAALAQPEPEPVAWMDAFGDCNNTKDEDFRFPLYARPPTAKAAQPVDQASTMLITGAGAPEDGEWVSAAECDRRVKAMRRACARICDDYANAYSSTGRQARLHRYVARVLAEMICTGGSRDHHDVNSSRS